MEKINSTNFHEFSAQEIFDFVCEKLVIQGEPAMTDRGGCGYNIKDRHCAAGWIITDLAISETDNKSLSWSGIIDKYHLSYKHKKLISNLQTAHDKAAKESQDREDDSYLDLLKLNLRIISRERGVNINEYIKA